MIKLSLCMIVKNEATSLPRCLGSVKNLVEEMVVLDTGSTDKTVEIAEELGAKVYHFQWCDDFAVARNEALKYVQGEWVLVLDADEVLTPKIFPQMQQAMAEKNNLVINLVRQEVGAIQSPYSLVSRLFRHHRAMNFSRPYHAIIDDSVTEILKQEKDWRVVNLPSVAILHYGYQQQEIVAKDKYNRARKAMEGFFANHPHDPYVCSKLGALYVNSGEFKKGVKLLKTGLKSNKAEPPLLFELHYHLGNAYARENEPEQAAKHYQKAIAQNILPHLKLGAYNNLGGLFQIGQDWQSAYQLFAATLKIDPTFAVGYYNLGITLKAMGKLQAAEEAYHLAIKYAPNDAAAYQNLGALLLKMGRIEESKQILAMAITLHEIQNPPAAKRLRQQLATIGILPSS